MHASIEDLVTISRYVAQELGSGWRPRAADPGIARLLHRDRAVEVWLRSWAATPFEALHDHGGSAGAVTVVRGELVEWQWVADPLPPPVLSALAPEEAAVSAPAPRRRVLAPGDTVGMPVGHVHDLGCRLVTGAESVQVYSPPLRRQSRYVTARGILRRLRTEYLTPLDSAA
jgi:Cysteine dioxygenase type I